MLRRRILMRRTSTTGIDKDGTVENVRQSLGSAVSIPLLAGGMAVGAVIGYLLGMRDLMADDPRARLIQLVLGTMSGAMFAVFVGSLRRPRR